MKTEELRTKLCEMGSSEATTLADALETIWWTTKTDEEARERAIMFLKNIQGWAKKSEDILLGFRKEL